MLFVCVHNAGRSQMAAGLLQHMAGDRIEVRSAGTQPRDEINPAAAAAMAEIGIDITAATPRILTDDAVETSDVVITMGCGDTCPFYPGCPTGTGNSTIPPASRSRWYAASVTRSPNG